ncbi:TPA: hypothetical protein DCE37_17810 [Candidatus Latescibacteria bacterium]|nr:hypothetical protein [Candidatus Latescibacterota bacterium]
MIGKITIALIAALIAFIIGVRMIANRSPRPDRLGVAGGKLLPCPDKPNCASSLEGLEPFPHSGDRGAAHAILLGILKTWPRTEVIQTTDDYIHVQFRSRVFSFIDDGEFYLPEGENVIHYRSAARMGHSDLGANASRMSDIRSALVETLK